MTGDLSRALTENPVAAGVGHRWAFAFLAAGLIVCAHLVNRFAPRRRHHVRRAFILFGLYAVAYGASLALAAAGHVVASDRALFLAILFEALTAVNLAALAIFDLALPAMSIELVSITSDILVGVAYIVIILWAIHSAGGNLSSLIATSAVVSGVIALSLQATLGNILGGVALQLDGSIDVGDWVQLENGKQGKVREIRWRHTVVETRDWDTIIVPNAALLAGNIILLGKREGHPLQHRMWVYFNVDFRFHPTAVIGAVTEALLASPIEHVAADPPPQVVCYDFAKDGRDSFAYYVVRYWLTDLAVDDPTSSVVRARVYSALKRAGIPLARPTTTTFVSLENDEAERSRLSRHRERRLAAIRAIDLLRGLTPEESAMLADRLGFAPFSVGETITKQGAVAHWLYILVSGRTEVRAKADGVARAVATINAPDFFGEMGLMTGEPRGADVVAVTDVECYRLDKESFEKILKDRPEIAAELSSMLAHRRVGLIAAREGLDAAAKRAREASEQQRILQRIQTFFGLAE